MKAAAEKGKDSTRELVAKYGRSARLASVLAACWTPGDLLRDHSRGDGGRDEVGQRE
jgi:hypothetical protein